MCELHGQDGGIVEVEQEDAGEEEGETGLMQTADSRRRAEETGTSSRTRPMTPSRGVREEELTPEDLAIMAACEADETWQTLRNMKPDTKQKFMSAVCILAQEIVEDNGMSARYQNWAKRWGEDQPEACQLHRTTYSLLKRHIMGIAAAQFVWEPEGETEDTAPHPGPQTSSASSAAPPPEALHRLPEGGECATATGTRKRIRHKTTPTETDDKHC